MIDGVIVCLSLFYSDALELPVDTKEEKFRLHNTFVCIFQLLLVSNIYPKLQ